MPRGSARKPRTINAQDFGSTGTVSQRTAHEATFCEPLGCYTGFLLGFRCVRTATWRSTYRNTRFSRWRRRRCWWRRFRLRWRRFLRRRWGWLDRNWNWFWFWRLGRLRWGRCFTRRSWSLRGCGNDRANLFWDVLRVSTAFSERNLIESCWHNASSKRARELLAALMHASCPCFPTQSSNACPTNVMAVALFSTGSPSPPSVNADFAWVKPLVIISEAARIIPRPLGEHAQLINPRMNRSSSREKLSSSVSLICPWTPTRIVRITSAENHLLLEYILRQRWLWKTFRARIYTNLALFVFKSLLKTAGERLRSNWLLLWLVRVAGLMAFTAFEGIGE